jgi:hypothetical protein
MESTETLPPQQGSVIKGIFICWGLNLLTLAFGSLLFVTFIGPLLLIGGIGLVQLLYVRPLYNTYKGKNEEGTCKGLVIAASVTALLNAGCWGSVALGGQ